ncbi:hypothetical protein RclHR1_04830009 [Rhizophagus clarus]|nr:hypothetical protein RclHR1_04830009 [Rhizophagus clarus]
MILFNLLLAVIILRREFKNNEQFRAWYQKHKVFCMFVVFCSPGGLNVLHVLNCKFNDMDIFDAKLSSTFEKKVIHASVISLLIGDLPRSCFSTFTNVVFQPYGFAYYAIPSISCLLTLSVFASGLFYRIYESTIRDYEKPTVQELIISKNQILEA